MFSSMATKVAPADQRRRPRHARGDSEREILDAAEQLISERPLREVTVTAIMSRTGLKRPAFWSHFRDLNDVIVRLGERITQDVVAPGEQWLPGGSTLEQALIAGLNRAVVAYTERGPLVRALADAARSDALAEATYTGFVEAVADGVVARIEADQAGGRIDQDLDPREIALALTWMTERYLYDAMTLRPRPDLETMVDVLRRMWTATLYSPRPGAARSLPSRRGCGSAS
jgi:AcrR family transcriptional regulator